MPDPCLSADASLDALVAQVLDDFRTRQQRGEHPEVEEYAARHPEAADLLRKVLATFQLLEASSSPSPPFEEGAAGGCSGALADDPPLSGTLGDFRLLREVGRGGMGIVYEAEQISLGRRVALKVLPFAATLDPRQLQRFQNEARAAASLRHEHIVAVHAVGQERGVHFFAMQFIDGQTLADVIREQRCDRDQESGVRSQGSGSRSQESAEKGLPLEPAADTLTLAGKTTEPTERGPAYFRRVAELMIQAAEAVEHAHQLGIVHRDLKPANLLLDAQGELWVADFGLAQIGADPRLTATGDMVGTLRYMSPEQAEGRRVILDPRADIYSLGVTLYELLTLEPAVPGGNREEILRHLTFDDPALPRQRNRAIAKDLETIVLKAIAKKPAERYGSMRELADDLRCYLEHTPIHARRPSALVRLGLWCRQIERIRDAGTFMFFVSLVFFAWCVLSIICVVTGAYQPGDPGQLLTHCLRCLVYYTLLMWMGRSAIRRKVWALWGGALLSLAGLAIAFYCAIMPDWPDQFGLRNVYPSDTNWLIMAEVNALFALLAAAQLGIVIIGLVAYYANLGRYWAATRGV